VTDPSPLPVAPPPRRPRWGRRVAAATVALVLTITGTVPWWGYDLAFFRVRRVEVRGARFARPSEVAARLRVDTTTSVWVPLDSLERLVRAHPQVRTASVRRWLPSTLIVELTEDDPIALVPGARGMRAFEESGGALPLDPSRVAADLPIVDRPDTAVFRLLADLKAENPAMFARISEVRQVGRDQVRIMLLNVRVLAMKDLGVERFDELSSVERDLARQGLVPTELDLRFKDQIIARLP
jgi:cell division protein FtsQ